MRNRSNRDSADRPRPASPRRRRPAEPGIVGTGAIAAKLEQSLRSTCRGLAAFRRSLEQAGLQDAVKPYRRMLLTLMQQRAWAAHHGRAELSPLWQELAATAGGIHAIMAEFATMMEALKHIDRDVTPERPREAPPAEVAAATEAAIALASVLGDFSLSPTRAAALGAGGNNESLSLDRLLAAGVFEFRGRGRRSSLRIGEAVRRDLADCLARRLNDRGKAAPSSATAG
ncbi:MAG: hypothetical protein ACREEP_20240 [Dongiaceae bacterium]